MITATDPVGGAEDLARRIGRRLSPVFAASRSGDSSSYCVRLVLRDLRRIEITTTAPAENDQDPPSGARTRNPQGAVNELIGSFRFGAVLAAVKAARGDVLIGAHLTLQLARHLLVIAMLLRDRDRDRDRERDRDAGTVHHRFGGSRWDAWASQLAGITAAIRYYSTMLDDITSSWDPPQQPDDNPLLELLDAVDRHGAVP
jgi:hypothetical protein